MFGVVFASLCAFGAHMKNQDASKTLQNGSKSTQREVNSTPSILFKSILFIFFENITFRTYFVNSHTLSKFKLILTANIERGLSVPKITSIPPPPPPLTSYFVTVFC